MNLILMRGRGNLNLEGRQNFDIQIYLGEKRVNPFLELDRGESRFQEIQDSESASSHPATRMSF